MVIMMASPFAGTFMPGSGRCEVQRAVDFIGLGEMPYPYTSKGSPIERENPFIVRNNNLCILCGRCVRVDQEILGIEAISFNRRGKDTFIGGAFGKTLFWSGCTFCGCCVEVCPVDALECCPWPGGFRNDKHGSIP
jgi:predicted molibdopterin-dependent oxidoreductase YjgC